jgi:hypothetical protein
MTHSLCKSLESELNINAQAPDFQHHDKLMAEHAPCARHTKVINEFRENWLA